MAKVRIDVLLVERGLAESRTLAQRLVMAGEVRADGELVPKPSSLVPPQAVLDVDRKPRFVSRGGEKLLAALQAFSIEVIGKTCADAGASTGGFTDCLLQQGAARVFTIDVGRGILHWKLRNDPRVVVMEECNARYLNSLPEPVDLITIDVSFISLKVLLPVVKGWFDPPHLPDKVEETRSEKPVIALIKPQFEAGRSQVARGSGVIHDSVVHRQVLENTLAFAIGMGYEVRGLVRSPLLGPKGNTEFLAWLDLTGKPSNEVKEFIDNVFK